MKKARNLVFLIFCTMAVALFHSPADAGDTLTRIKARGHVRCGVSDGIQGFSYKEPDGRWSGMDADFCRARLPPSWGTPERWISFRWPPLPDLPP